MENRVQALRALNVPIEAIDCATGKLRLPYAAVCQPTGFWGFPPALIPLWDFLEGPIVVGYWKHWFVHRDLVLVKVYVDLGFEMVEYARTFQQLLRLVAMEVMCIEGGVTEEVKDFARAASIDDLEEIDRITNLSGDDPVGLLSLKSFRESAPLLCFDGGRGYAGDFPNRSMDLSDTRLRQTSSLELEPALLERVRLHKGAPEWLSAEEQAPIFETLLTRGDLAGAWMSLNSSGWSFRDAREALQRLKKEADDPAFSAMTAAWLELDHERSGGY